MNALVTKNYVMTVYYRRRRLKNDDGEYGFDGKVVLKYEEEDAHREPFINWSFKKIVARMHEFVNEYDCVVKVIMQRTERDDVLPMELSSSMLHVLNTDPLGALRVMMHNPEQSMQSRYSNFMKQKNASISKAAEEFGEDIFIRIRSGTVQDPETGEWKKLAYGERHGWRIDRGDRKPNDWLRINLIDDAPEGATFAERVAFTQWATVNVWSLLSQVFEKYYLPRGWNTEGPWIGHEELKKRAHELEERTG